MANDLDKLRKKSLYTVLKACFLGAKNSEVHLNARQAANLQAGGFVVQGKIEGVKK